MWWLLACVREFPSPPDARAGDTDPGMVGGSGTHTSIDTSTTRSSDTGGPTGDTGADTGAHPGATGDTGPTLPTDPLAELSDEFDSDEGRWTLVHTVDGSLDRLESWDIGVTQPGWARILPQPCAWYGSYRGVLIFQEVTGDFLVQSRLVVTNRGGTYVPPGPNFSLAGLMMRAPVDGAEDYVFGAVGKADEPSFSWETKNTVGSASTVVDEPIDDGEVDLALLRLGDAAAVFLRASPKDPWELLSRFCRADLPATLQVGMAAAADYAACSAVGLPTYDTTEITGNADVDARYDYVRFATPPALAPANDPCALTDQELLDHVGSQLTR